MCNKFGDFLNEIKYAGAREELEDHLEEKTNYLIKEKNLNRETATKIAIEEMGNPKEISRGLKKAHGFYRKIAMAFCIGVACITGIILIAMIPSPGFVEGNIGIIGGADGPTAIFVETDTSFIMPIMGIVFCICIGMLIYLLYSRKRKR